MSALVHHDWPHVLSGMEAALARLAEDQRAMVVLHADVARLLIADLVGRELTPDGFRMVVEAFAGVRLGLGPALAPDPGRPPVVVEALAVQARDFVEDAVREAVDADVAEALRAVHELLRDHDAKVVRQLRRHHRWILSTSGVSFVQRLCALDALFALLGVAAHLGSDDDLAPWRHEVASEAMRLVDELRDAAPDGLEGVALPALHVEEVDGVVVTMAGTTVARAADLAWAHGDAALARRIVDVGLAEHAEDEVVRAAARRVAPPEVQAVAGRADRGGLAASRAWIARHGGSHAGRWVAVRDGALLAEGPSLASLSEVLGDARGGVVFARMV